MTRLDTARQQLRTLESLADRYVWAVLRRYRQVAELTAYGPLGFQRIQYQRQWGYLYEVYRTTEEITRREYGRVPTIEEMILVWRDEAERLERLAEEERRRGKKRYILRGSREVI
jgi:hypothetical protein